MTKREIADNAIKSIYNGVIPSDILTIEKKRIGDRDIVVGAYVGEEKLPEKDILLLQEEIRTLKNMYVWKLINSQLEKAAIQQGMMLSQNYEQTLYGKAILFCQDVTRRLFESILNIKIDKPEKPKKD